MAAGNNPLGGSFEKLNQSTGGVAGGVAKSLSSVGKAFTTDVAKGITKAPVDMLKDIVGGQSKDVGGEEEVGVGQVSPSSSGNSGGKVSGAPSTHSKFQTKIEEDRRKVAERLRRHRAVLQEERERDELRKREEQEREHMQVLERQEEKEVEIKQLEQQKKQESLAVQQARKLGGTREGVKRKF